MGRHRWQPSRFPTHRTPIHRVRNTALHLRQRVRNHTEDRTRSSQRVIPPALPNLQARKTPRKPLPIPSRTIPIHGGGQHRHVPLRYLPHHRRRLRSQRSANDDHPSRRRRNRIVVAHRIIRLIIRSQTRTRSRAPRLDRRRTSRFRSHRAMDVLGNRRRHGDSSGPDRKSQIACCSRTSHPKVKSASSSDYSRCQEDYQQSSAQLCGHSRLTPCSHGETHDSGSPVLVIALFLILGYVVLNFVQVRREPPDLEEEPEPQPALSAESDASSPTS